MAVPTCLFITDVFIDQREIETSARHFLNIKAADLSVMRKSISDLAHDLQILEEFLADQTHQICHPDLRGEGAEWTTRLKHALLDSLFARLFDLFYESKFFISFVR